MSRSSGPNSLATVVWWHDDRGVSDERCIHDMLPGQCGQRPCKDTPRGLTARVYITEGGDVFHRLATCEALREGQRKARGRGQEIHEPRAMDVLDALAIHRAACIPCFPDYAPADSKLCWVRVDGRWVKGLLTKWTSRTSRSRTSNGRVGSPTSQRRGRSPNSRRPRTCAPVSPAKATRPRHIFRSCHRCLKRARWNQRARALVASSPDVPVQVVVDAVSAAGG